MKTLLLIITISHGLVLYSQTDYKWDEVVETTGTQSDIYSRTKLFVAETWKSAKDVIQNDDKEAGIILLKAKSKQNIVFSLVDHVYYFSYTVKLYQKEGKARIVIEDVVCTDVFVEGGYSWPLLPVSDTYPDKGLKTTGMNEKNYLTIMASLKAELQSIVDKFKVDIAKTSEVESEDW